MSSASQRCGSFTGLERPRRVRRSVPAPLPPVWIPSGHSVKVSARRAVRSRGLWELDTRRRPGVFLRCAQEGKLVKALLQTWSQQRALDPHLWGHSSVQRAGRPRLGMGSPAPCAAGRQVGRNQGCFWADGLLPPSLESGGRGRVDRRPWDEREGEASRVSRRERLWCGHGVSPEDGKLGKGATAAQCWDCAPKPTSKP